jgi:hypothetical protein
MRTAVEEACWLAVNLARNCNFAVFPCKQDKTPATPHGFNDATRPSEKVLDLWARHPGPLVGIATGAVSGISVLDLDAKHDAACAWWVQHEHLIPATRRFRTRSGGMHIYFRHCPGIRNTQGKIVPGVDTRGDGGYVIHWFSAGLPCFDQSPPAPWPSWLVGLVNPPKPPAPRRERPRRRGDDDAAVDALTRIVRDAAEDERNGKLFWAANRMRERDATRSATEAILIPAAREAGLADFEARRTIASAWRGA